MNQTVKFTCISLILQVLWFWRHTYAIDCYQCNNLRNISACHNIVTCNLDEFCYTDTTGVGTETRFTMGCRSIQVCRAQPSTTASSLSIIGRSIAQRLDCSQCCDADACNKHICTVGIPVTNLQQCQDDPDFNCKTVSTVFNLCGDSFHAQIKCPKFCGFCDHPIVHGHWSTWQSWSSCSVTCGNGVKSRMRLCDNPAPQNGGLFCQGFSNETGVCFPRSCPIHGGWARWSAWGSCSVTCGIGLARRDRSCSNPYPDPDGDPCWGDARDDRPCFTRACSDGGWSRWTSWGSCSASCLGGTKTRSRTCDNPRPSNFGRDCVGNSVETIGCNSVNCPVTNGQWSTWQSWSSCSSQCNVGIRRRIRTCNNPAPSEGGHACVGNSEQVDICNRIDCSLMYTEVRLSSGGRLEVNYNGTWGTVCDDSFGVLAAKVICRMLGHSTSSASVVSNTNVPDGSGPIWLDDVVCLGTEESIFDCKHREFGNHNCRHTEDVGVSC